MFIGHYRMVRLVRTVRIIRLMVPVHMARMVRPVQVTGKVYPVISSESKILNLTFQPHKSQQHTFFHSVTRIYSKTESVDQTLSSEENYKDLINALEDFYLLWSCISLILIAFVLLAIILVRMKRRTKRRRPTSANIDLNLTKPYSYEPLPYKSII